MRGTDRRHHSVGLECNLLARTSAREHQVGCQGSQFIRSDGFHSGAIGGNPKWDKNLC